MLGPDVGIGGVSGGGSTPPAPNLAILLTSGSQLARALTMPGGGGVGKYFHNMAWFKRTAAMPDDYALVLEQAGSTPYAQAYLRGGGAGALSLDNGQNADESYGGTLTLDTWMHLCLSSPYGVAGNTLLYLDGVQIATAISTGMAITAVDAILGRSSTYRFVGAVTSFKYGMTTGVLSAPEFAAEMASRSAIKAGLSALSLNGASDLSGFTATGDIETVDGPEELS